MAEQVGESGKVIGIENNSNQLQAAKKEASLRSVRNAEFKLCSAYEIDTLSVYLREKGYDITVIVGSNSKSGSKVSFAVL